MFVLRGWKFELRGTTQPSANPKLDLAGGGAWFDTADATNRFNMVDVAANINNKYPLKFVT